MLREDYGMDKAVAEHLRSNYGTRALALAAMARDDPELVLDVNGSKQYKRLSNKHMLLDAEVVFAVRQEFACTAVDVLARRTRLSFLDAQVRAIISVVVVVALTRGPQAPSVSRVSPPEHRPHVAQAAVEALPRVIDLMARELSWSRARKIQARRAHAHARAHRPRALPPRVHFAARRVQEREDARKFLATMYVPVDDGKTAQDVVDAVIARGANRKLTRQLTRLDTTKVIEPAK